MKSELRKIYEENGDGLYAMAMAVTRNADMAEEAVQEAFSRLLKSSCEPKGDVLAYVFATVRNTSLDLLRRLSGVRRQVHLYDLAKGGSGDGREEAVEERFEDPKAISPEKAAIDRENTQRLMEAVSALPPAQREIVQMRLNMDLTFDQIATILDAPLSTVLSRHRRALIKLRMIYEIVS